MNTDPRCHEITVRVYYEDTDLAGVVYYANYLRFIERGRTDALRAEGIDQVSMRAEEGLVFVVTRLSADYHAPARFDDLLRVTTRISRVGGASCEMEQHVWRGTERLFTASVRVACMTLHGMVSRMPVGVRECLKRMVGG